MTKPATESATATRHRMPDQPPAWWFLKNFCSAAQERNLETATNFDITECCLVQEVIKEDRAPSPASGIVEAERVATSKLFGCWNSFATRLLLTTQEKWSTHLAGDTSRIDFPHSFNMDFNGAKGTSFFQIFKYSSSLGSSGRVTTNTMEMIIFDVMTHTREGDSGIGDHGVKGIEKWRDQHDCNAFCKHLELDVGDDDEED
ncbi:hypothetical protein B0H13DRAFT_1856426 [Mycena leptocephala]|nr:hypothetical protein B0H13DRAFT_1856426 [Mycena leptocephala]